MDNNEEFIAEFIGIDGFKCQIQGTIAQCSNWADNVIRLHGEGTVTIKSIDKEAKQ